MVIQLKKLLGKMYQSLNQIILKEEIKKLIEKIKQGEKSSITELLRLKKDGTIINVSVTLSPVFDILES